MSSVSILLAPERSQKDVPTTLGSEKETGEALWEWKEEGRHLPKLVFLSLSQLLNQGGWVLLAF